jgi:sugar (pentulose or hexulose) kinase
MDYLAGIDLGSTSLKCVIYDLSGNVVASGSRPTERYNPYPDHPEWTVWQPDQIWGGTAAAMREAVSKLDDPRCIKAVAVTGMGMDGVPVDEQGSCLYPFISWHDSRTEAQLWWWEKNIGADNTFRIGGNTLWRFNTALRLLWMAEYEPDILARTDKWLLVEGLDYQVLDIVAALRSGLEIDPDRLVAVGGAKCNQFWMQNKADVLGLSIEVPEVEDATPLGAAILAGIGIGLYRDEQDAFEQVYKPGKTYQPDSQLVAKYAEWYQIYKQLYPALKPVSHQLYDQFRV